MESVALVKILVDTITDDNIEVLRTICEKLPLGRMTVDASNSLLAQLLDVAALNDRVECADVLYDVWQVTNLEEERYSLIAYMLGRSIFTDRAITIAMRARGDITFKSLFDEIISRDDSPETLLSLSRLFKLVEVPSYLELVDLKKKIESIEKEEDLPLPRMKMFLNEQIEEKAPFAEIPGYLIESGQTDEELENISIELPITVESLPIDEKVDLLTSGLGIQGISVEEVEKHRAALRKELESMTPEDQAVLLNPVLEDLNLTEMTDNVELFRRFGPNHPVYGTILDDTEFSDPCQRFGGCRMFLCVCSETVRDEDELGRTLDVIYEPDEVDWFKGVCDFCHRRIAKECYAVRRALDSGGWLGCYCSWKCTRNDTPNDELAIQALINHFEDKVNELKIYDRTYEEIEETEEEEE